MKRLFLSIAVVILFCLTVAGCSHIPKETREYKEWYEALQIEDRQGFKYGGFSSDDNHIHLSIECNYNNLGDFAKVVSRHNEFVRQNPDYFPKDTAICFISYYESPMPFLDCYNKPGDYFGEAGGIGIEENSEIKYISANLFQLEYAYKKYKNEFSIPVLVLTTDTPENVHAQNLEFLEQFKDLDQIIVNYNALGYDMTPTLEGINKYAPGVEVYQVVDGGELQKWQ